MTPPVTSLQDVVNVQERDEALSSPYPVYFSYFLVLSSGERNGLRAVLESECLGITTNAPADLWLYLRLLAGRKLSSEPPSEPQARHILREDVRAVLGFLFRHLVMQSLASDGTVPTPV